MVQKFKEGMISDKVAERILWLSILFFIIFFGTTILSYYLLPEGFLLRKNRISDFKTSENFFMYSADFPVQHYNILHISPLSYVSPDGPDLSCAMDDGNWPVLHHTAMGLPGGYEDWLLDCLLAISWAKTQPGVLADRLSFFGTSQGGGGSLLLASILQGAVRCVCADLPFLTAFPLSGLSGEAYGILQEAYGTVEPSLFWNRLGFIDTVSHSHRLTMPVMLSAGGKDQVCPPATIEFLFSRLPGSKQFTFLEDAVHTHSRQSMILCRSWMALYA